VETTLETARHDYHLDELATKMDLENRGREAEFTLGAKIAKTKADLSRWIYRRGCTANQPDYRRPDENGETDPSHH
jgi:hypothetical protein